jgi:SAM-dependent methyltransferase
LVECAKTKYLETNRSSHWVHTHVTLTFADPATAAYEALAPFYDRYTEGYDHERWLANLERVARDHGLRGQRLLDVGCGTGKSFAPMLRRGYEVVACDISPAMVEHARAVAGDEADVLVADVRELPVLGRFDLVTALDDAFNYLVSDDELSAALRGVARNLRPGGMLVFDVNTLATYRGFFTSDAAIDVDGAFMCWRGEGDPEAEPGCLSTSTVEVFSSDDGECWTRTRSHHVQRHHPAAVVERLLRDAGLELVDRRGQVTGAALDPGGDEDQHAKLVYFARRVTTSQLDGSPKGVSTE